MHYFPAIVTVLPSNPVEDAVSHIKDFLAWTKQVNLQILEYF